ncbi:hypothetical protein [Saccharopolyspora shandongensis]|uniref:hypothetical protein n=1 Tax=Saccharopolyspora shandongensis TaxID=418495 RepID=UPI0033FABD12
MDVEDLERDLRAEVDAEVVRFDAGSRGVYSTDAPNYRQVPIGVVVRLAPNGTHARSCAGRPRVVPERGYRR